ncbi:cytochrome c oxidase subunit 3 [Imperialibacter roseus]|jgi:cytochrome c oxidase subunit III|uniref:Cytochrome c oxidase subunit 3 n=1 Tax=Imperialibacter roseus TaxID=1324217 RepID=A0ABZ0J0D8_9BACT|nr:cytochrome c oxidase subunit 3 [Imperialibacter roseus]WOK09640.1 cytochrome c oxidase subunit 3 [Imperialibacter roseus]|tara:strand:- start:466 stop:1215 length:750 start_codon:yes stop_codon:yes gene_type:complete
MSSTAVVASDSDKDLWMGGNEPLKASYGKLMMWFFLLSDAFSFSGLLIAYGMIRFSHPAFQGSPDEFVFSQEYWPIPEKVFEAVPFLHGISLPLVFVGIMTFVLILSSVTMVLAVEAGQRMDRKGVEKWMLWTILGGLAFLGCQAWEWTHFIVGTEEGGRLLDGTFIHGANLSQNQYGPPNFAALFFFITGFHGFHVFSGVCLNFLIFYQATVGKLEKVGHYEMVEKVGLYWHFVDLVWVFVFTFFYLV